MFPGASMSPAPPVLIQVGPVPPALNAGEITAEELSLAMRSGAALRILDLRHATDFPKGRVPGAVSAPAITGRTLHIRDYCPAGKKIVLYSWVGASPTTQAMANELATLGVPVFVLKGGWEGWIVRGWPVESAKEFQNSSPELLDLSPDFDYQFSNADAI